jgi:hypothetical protein
MLRSCRELKVQAHQALAAPVSSLDPMRLASSNEQMAVCLRYGPDSSACALNAAVFIESPNS